MAGERGGGGARGRGWWLGGEAVAETGGGAGGAGADEGESGVVAEDGEEEEAGVDGAEVEVFVAAFVGEAFKGGFAETACGFADGVIGTGGEGGGFAVIVEGVVAGLGADGAAFFDESGAGGIGVVAVRDEDLAERGGGFPVHEERA